MSEKATFRAFAEQCAEQDPQRIESRTTGRGIADVWCRDAAVELKCLPSYPKRVMSKVVLKHPLSMEQYRWLNKRWRSGGRAFVLLQVKRLDWYLFAAPDSFVLVPGHEVDAINIKRHCLWWSDKGIAHQEESYLHLKDYLSMRLDKIEAIRQDTGLVHRCQYL